MKHVDPKKHIHVIKKVFAARGAESQQVLGVWLNYQNNGVRYLALTRENVCRSYISYPIQ